MVVIHNYEKYYCYRPSTEEPEAWTGRWLPERLTVRPKTQTEDNAMKQLTNGRIPMGIKNDKCDDAKVCQKKKIIQILRKTHC